VVDVVGMCAGVADRLRQRGSHGGEVASVAGVIPATLSSFSRDSSRSSPLGIFPSAPPAPRVLFRIGRTVLWLLGSPPRLALEAAVADEDTEEFEPGSCQPLEGSTWIAVVRRRPPTSLGRIPPSGKGQNAASTARPESDGAKPAIPDVPVL
jgi:hypothetical protein